MIGSNKPEDTKSTMQSLKSVRSNSTLYSLLREYEANSCILTGAIGYALAVDNKDAYNSAYTSAGVLYNTIVDIMSYLQDKAAPDRIDYRPIKPDGLEDHAYKDIKNIITK